MLMDDEMYKRSVEVFAYEDHLLLTFANSLDSDQAQQNICPDLETNYLTLWKINFEKLCSWEKKTDKIFQYAKSY